MGQTACVVLVPNARPAYALPHRTFKVLASLAIIMAAHKVAAVGALACRPLPPETFSPAKPFSSPLVNTRQIVEAITFIVLKSTLPFSL